MSYVFLNGAFVKSDEAMVSVFDQGFLYGDGIFESFRSVGDRLYQFPQHFKRLLQSAEALCYPIAFTEQELETILLELREKNRLNDAYYRVTITRGKGQIGFQRDMDNDLTCLVVGREFQGFDSACYEQRDQSERGPNPQKCARSDQPENQVNQQSQQPAWANSKPRPRELSK